MAHTMTGTDLSALTAVFAAFADLEVTVDATVVDPPHVVSEPVAVALARLMIADGGVITHQRSVFDFTGLLVQVGVLRAKPGNP